jgi:superfamily II DNA/RNA helicase
MSEEKKQILDRWTQASNTPHIVATTSLAEGFDYPHVRLVMNVDEPESLVIFAQESGRAGRVRWCYYQRPGNLFGMPSSAMRFSDILRPKRSFLLVAEHC